MGKTVSGDFRTKKYIKEKKNTEKEILNGRKERIDEKNEGENETFEKERKRKKILKGGDNGNYILRRGNKY